MKITYAVFLSLCAIAQVAHAIKPTTKNNPVELFIHSRAGISTTQPQPSPQVLGIDERIERVSNLMIAALKKLCCCREKKL